jgi:outer membrane protein TolC
MSAQDARELITLAVSGTYLQILASKANVASQEAQVKQAEATFKQSEDRYAAGTKPVIDRNRSFVEFHTEQQRLTSLRGDLVKQTMQLARLIGLPVGQLLTLTEDLPSHVPEAISLDDAIKLALDNRSDLKAARMQLKAASEAHRASKAEYLPAVAVDGDYGLQGINPNKGASVFQASGTVTIPIFQSGRVRADIEQADAALSQRQAEYADEAGIVELDVRQAYVDLQVATEQIAVARENRRVAAETLRESLDRFAAGVADSVEVVQSQETVASAERDYVSSLFSLNLSRISLARATGQAEQFIPNMLKGN